MKNGGIRLAARNSVIHLSSAIPMLLCAQQSLAHFKDFEDNENENHRNSDFILEN